MTKTTTEKPPIETEKPPIETESRSSWMKTASTDGKLLVIVGSLLCVRAILIIFLLSYRIWVHFITLMIALITIVRGSVKWFKSS